MESNKWSNEVPKTREVGQRWPEARRRHGAVVHNSIMYVLFGETRFRNNAAWLPLSDTWSYDIPNRRWKSLAKRNGITPPARGMHTTVVKPDCGTRGCIYVFGGAYSDGQTANDMYRFDLHESSWSSIEKVRDVIASLFDTNASTQCSLPTRRQVAQALWLFTSKRRTQ